MSDPSVLAHRAPRALRRATPVLLAALAAGALALALPAAAMAGVVRGRVLDPTDSPLPGVTVSLTNDLTGF